MSEPKSETPVPVMPWETAKKEDAEERASWADVPGENEKSERRHLWEVVDPVDDSLPPVNLEREKLAFTCFLLEARSTCHEFGECEYVLWKYAAPKNGRRLGSPEVDQCRAGLQGQLRMALDQVHRERRRLPEDFYEAEISRIFLVPRPLSPYWEESASSDERLLTLERLQRFRQYIEWSFGQAALTPTLGFPWSSPRSRQSSASEVKSVEKRLNDGPFASNPDDLCQKCRSFTPNADDLCRRCQSLVLNPDDS